MRHLLLAAIAVTLPAAAGAQPEVVPRAGLVITTSTRFTPGSYQLPAPTDTGRALIVVRGSNITVDLSGVTLAGAPPDAIPDAGAGTALLVDGGENVTIRGATIRGYKIAILARGTRNLRILDNDLSHNWKPRLFSIVEHESIADWLSYHQNEKDEWMRYGAAIYLTDARGGEVRGNTVRQGMNALLVTRTDSLLVWNNDFSFNSGLGVGLYRSDHNRIMHNRADFNVRGYSEGFYRRGQDSAAILIYQQSDSNIVAYNSATHSGDGFFLWAGQHTMDTGQGGANDNVVYRNDFSWAPTNGIEATFSRNSFVENRVVGSDYGVWGGYSFDTFIAGNTFERNRVGIAIEHGQNNRIIGNTFRGDSTAVSLWANRIEPSDWGYPKHRDTRSLNPRVEGNDIRGARVAFRIGDTREGRIAGNVVIADTFMVVRGDTTGLRVEHNLTTPPLDVAARAPAPAPARAAVPARLRPEPLAGGMAALPARYAEWPRSRIVVDEWGPYDWNTLKLWPADSSLSTPLQLRVLGPRDGIPWTVASLRGATVSRTSGVEGDTIVVTPDAGAVEDWSLTVRKAGSGSREARYARFNPRVTWDVKVYSWTDSATHPIEHPDAFAALLRGERGSPVFTTTTGRLAYVWYRPPARVRGWPQERAAVLATTRVNLPDGDYTIRAISDDGIRVFVNGRLLIEDWSVHGSRVREAPLDGGEGGAHDIRVEYFQRDGWAELQVEILRRKP